ncbi:MAG: GntR family transcriptional regulator [Cyanobacteria bacterium RYN_339]|nr:GntR family transcriptional regulator [Cyanobacteria bacterium RYN_339]
MTNQYSTGTIPRMKEDSVMVEQPGHPLPPRGERAAALAAHLRGRIEAGIVRPGARLPSVRQLADEWGVSRFTVVEAYDRLTAAGWAEARRGAGFYAQMPSSSAPAKAQEDPMPTGPAPTWLVSAMLRTHVVDKAPGGGLVPPGWLDAGLASRALRTIARNEDAWLGYGEAQGVPALRQALGRKLGEIGIPDDPNLVITSIGATQGLDLVAGALVSPGDTVLVDDPGFFLPFAQLAARGAHVVGVPWVGDGPDLAALDELVARHRPRLYLTTASLHNPTGGHLSPAKAHRVLRLAEATGMWIVEDDVYGDLAMHPPPRLAALDGLSRVIHLGSFSKTLAAGWRVGYIAAPVALVPLLVERKLLAGMTTPQPAELAVASILADGAYRRYVARLRERVAKARGRALKAIAAAGFTPLEPAGEGMFVWAQGQVDAQVVAARLWQDGILAAPGALFSPSGAASTWMRINVAAAEHAPLLAAMAAANRG